MTGCSSRSADACGSPDETSSGTPAPVPAVTSGGGVREGRPGRSGCAGPGCACPGWPGPGWPGDGPDSAWSMLRVLAEDRFHDSHTMMIAPDERRYSYLESTIDQRAAIW